MEWFEVERPYSRSSCATAASSTAAVPASFDYGCCNSCHLVLHEPFILCHDFTCSKQSTDAESSPTVSNSSQVYICSQCFSKGREFSQHKNDHDYSIVKTDFPLLDTEWNADEEMLLLNAVLQFGHGNWDDIARQVGSQKTPSECKHHFEKHYIDNLSGEFNSTWEDESLLSNKCLRVDEPISCPAQTQEISGAPLGGPVRPKPGSIIFKELAGYNAARADFESEYDNTAELGLNGIEVTEDMYQYVQDYSHGKQLFKNYVDESDEEEKLVAALSVTMLDVYNNKLKARNRRKRMVREYGLLNKSKAVCLPSRYPYIRNLPKYDQLFRYGAKLFCAFELDYFLEGLHHEIRLRQTILHLQEYRKAGLNRLAGINVFHKLKVARERHLRELSTMTEGVQDWLLAKMKKRHISFYEDNAMPGRLLPTTLGATRRTYAPLDIVGLSKYDQLTSDERQLCSDNRVVPEIYLQIKQIMIQECLKQDGLRLADIRPLVKIDVNKTRKLYDYFVQNELIYKPPSEGVD